MHKFAKCNCFLYGALGTALVLIITWGAPILKQDFDTRILYELNVGDVIEINSDQEQPRLFIISKYEVICANNPRPLLSGYDVYLIKDSEVYDDGIFHPQNTSNIELQLDKHDTIKIFANAQCVDEDYLKEKYKGALQ